MLVQQGLLMTTYVNRWTRTLKNKTEKIHAKPKEWLFHNIKKKTLLLRFYNEEKTVLIRMII